MFGTELSDFELEQVGAGKVYAGPSPGWGYAGPRYGYAGPGFGYRSTSVAVGGGGVFVGRSAWW